MPALAADQYTYLVGLRTNATRLDFPVGDDIDATVDVGTGNLSVLTSDLKLPGIQHDWQLGLAFNSLTVGAPKGSSGTFSGIAGEWTDRIGNDTSVNLNADGSVSYFGPDGFQGKFLPLSPSGYSAPIGLKATLTGSATAGWTIQDHSSYESMNFAASGRLTSVTDRNGKSTFLVSSSGKLATITSDRSGASSKVANLTYDASGRLQTVSQTSDVSGSRTVTYSYTNGDLTSLQDAAGRMTTFGYTANGNGDDLTSITNTGGEQTQFTFDASHRVTSVLRINASGANAKTRLQYSSSTQTLVAAPNTNGAGSVSAVPHTTYTLDATERVTAVSDPLNRSQARTYTPFGDVASATTAMNEQSTQGFNSNVNGGESPVSTQSPMGAGATLGYTGVTSTNVNPYLPTSGSDTQGNASTYSYDAKGNAQDNTNALAAKASVAYNISGSILDGTLKTSTSPANQVTTYTDDTSKHEITTITPPAGSGLGAIRFTYDGYGRLATVTDGRGTVKTYTYDNLDRVTGIAYSGGYTIDPATSVGYTFDTAGNLKTRTDATGTTTWGYDGLNRMTSRQDGAGVSVSYGYDPSGNLTSATSGFGTTTYTYDAANQLSTYTGPNSLPTFFYYDADGHRTDTYWRAQAPVAPATKPTTFTAHSYTSYDPSGRPIEVFTSINSNDSNRVFDKGFCYSKYVAGQPCPRTKTAAGTTDTGLVQWTLNILNGANGARSDYTYDAANRLTGVTNYNGQAGVNYSYTYDVNGNRTTAVSGGTTQSLTVNLASNEITTAGYTYDAAGNLTTDPSAGNLTYNKAGQMNTRASSTTYTYAGEGMTELTHEVSPPSGTTWDYSYGLKTSAGVSMLSSVTKNGSTSYFTSDPTTGASTEMHLASGQDDYYVTDNMGSVMAMVSQDSGGTLLATYAYDPYGTITAINNVAGTTATVAINTNPYGHTGGIVDPSTGWTRHGQRFNDTTTGRWQTVDPITRLTDPANANPYAYAGSNPINNVDPTGRFDENPFISASVVAFAITGLSLSLGANPIEAGAIGGCILTGGYEYFDQSEADQVVSACVDGAIVGAALAALPLLFEG